MLSYISQLEAASKALRSLIPFAKDSEDSERLKREKMMYETKLKAVYFHVERPSDSTLKLSLLKRKQG